MVITISHKSYTWNTLFKNIENWGNCFQNKENCFFWWWWNWEQYLYAACSSPLGVQQQNPSKADKHSVSHTVFGLNFSYVPINFVNVYDRWKSFQFYFFYKSRQPPHVQIIQPAYTPQDTVSRSAEHYVNQLFSTRISYKNQFLKQLC